tara:strand:- start:528 stop:887 length:360 start_codon:yes stop_codon:yes gene_type:complete
MACKYLSLVEDAAIATPAPPSSTLARLDIDSFASETVFNAECSRSHTRRCWYDNSPSTDSPTNLFSEDETMTDHDEKEDLPKRLRELERERESTREKSDSVQKSKGNKGDDRKRQSDDD